MPFIIIIIILAARNLATIQGQSLAGIRKAAQEPSSHFSKATSVTDKGIHRFPLQRAGINEGVSHFSFAEF